ncbi:MAG: alanine racemase [Clostridia bacterium]|nr:alanine racemase [Clostridia bacterium]
MYQEALRPAWAEIDLRNFDYNVKSIIQKVGKDRQIIGVIKADAYGHGAIACAQVLRDNGCRIFAIATLHEAIALREAGAKEEIICLGLTPDLYADTVVKYQITAVTCSEQNACAISREAVRQGKQASVLIAVDTGMGRIGYQAEEVDRAAKEITAMEQMPNLTVKGMFSHMSSADCIDKAYAMFQANRYKAFYEGVAARGVKLPFRTFANSASIMEIPDVYYDAVRPGIILYGCYPSDEMRREELDIRPVMSVKASIVHLKDVPAGFSVGYGRKYISQRPAKIATIALGYADGYPRPYSSQAKVIVNGVLCPIAGNICMDQCMIDVTAAPDVKLGDEVIVMGSDGKLSVTADDIARATGTINYEITCAFGQRLPKVFIR